MKLLYIKCDPKPEERSACLRVGRAFVHEYARRFPDHGVEELDLYHTELPELTAELIAGRNRLPIGEAYERLPFEAQARADLIKALCTQFLSADFYAIAAPMWSLSFPPRLKAYFDCIAQDGRTLRTLRASSWHTLGYGLLGDRPRRVVFIQSCGGCYGNPVSGRHNHANHYLRDFFLSLGMDDYLRLPVDGTELADTGVEAAITQAVERIDGVLDDLMME